MVDLAVRCCIQGRNTWLFQVATGAQYMASVWPTVSMYRFLHIIFGHLIIATIVLTQVAALFSDADDPLFSRTSHIESHVLKPLYCQPALDTPSPIICETDLITVLSINQSINQSMDF